MITENEITKYIYEGARLEAEWSNRSIIPEKWDKRDIAFKKQMIGVSSRYLKMEQLPTPEEAHDSWMKSYFKMGWKYGEERNVTLKTHPDLIAYSELPKDEKDKDAIFLALVWLAKAILDKIKEKEDEPDQDPFIENWEKPI